MNKLPITDTTIVNALYSIVNKSHLEPDFSLLLDAVVPNLPHITRRKVMAVDYYVLK